MIKTPIFHVALVITAVVIAVFVTFFQFTEIRQHSDLNAVECGWPFRFVTIDKSRLDPPLPYEINCSFFGGLEFPDEHNWGFFVFDVFFFYALFLGGIGVVSLTRKK